MPFNKINETAAVPEFLTQCQQQAIRSNQSQIASWTVSIAPTAPWLILSVLGETEQRHFYYDSPQQWAIVGLGVVVGCDAAGETRFSQAQNFVQTWQSQFIYADPNPRTVTAGRFFCSATFFDAPETAIAPQPSEASRFLEGSHLPKAGYFEPVYLFVPQVQVLTMERASIVTFNCLMTAETDIAQTLERMNEQLRRLMTAVSLGGAKPASHKVVSKDVVHFEGAVRAALNQIQAQRNGGMLQSVPDREQRHDEQQPYAQHHEQLHKVVMADVMDVVAPQAVDVVRSLQTLRQNHPDCTVFSVGNGRGQSFIGASPERLLSINNGQLTTDALAGSASRGETPTADAEIGQALLHSDKERYEHRVVVEFIARQLRSLGLEPHYLDAPHLLQLLHIQHLHTPMGATLDPQKVSPLDVLAKLHPTPAVAGVPRRAACELIRQQETFDRGLYAAPIGWIDTEGNSEFIVGIRSALIDGCKARLYAGAGIVAGSEPAKELAEIKLKLQTLLNALV